MNLCLPEDWDLIPISSLGKIVTGSTPSTTNPDFWEGSFLFVTPSEMKEDKYVTNAPRRITTLALLKSRPIPGNSVLVTCIGSIGKTAMVRTQVVTNQQINSIACNSSSNPHFVYYLMLTTGKTLKDHASQTTLPILNKGNFSAILVQRPPLSEQMKIAAVLSKLQKAMEVQDQLIQSLRDLKKSAMNHLFTHGLKNEKLKKTEIGMMPQSWEVKQVGSITTVAQYGLSLRGHDSGQFPILRMNCQVDGRVVLRDLQYVDIDDKTLDRFQIGDSDILFNRTNSFELVGRTAVFHSLEKVVFASYLIRLKIKREVMNPDCFNYYFNMESTQKALKTLATRGVSQSNISASKLKTFKIPVPSVKEQSEITHILQAIDKKLENHESQKAAFQALFKTMLNKLMTGQIRVKDLDIDTTEVDAA